MLQNNHSEIKTPINNLYAIIRKIGSGSFGVVYLGKNILDLSLVAIKIEIEKKDQSTQFIREASYLIILKNVKQVPNLIWHGSDGIYNIMVIQLLGKDLSNHFKEIRQLKIKYVLNIAIQMLNILEQIHKCSILHRDIKPENIVFGLDQDSHLLYLVDFGISKIFRTSNGDHIQYSEQNQFQGTSRYASIAAHRGQQLGRKDDLESLGYMLIYLLKGKLPWQDIKFTTLVQKLQRVGQMKQNISIDELCQNIPEEFAMYLKSQKQLLFSRYLNYIACLGFSENPNYNYLRQIFKNLEILNNLDQQDKSILVKDNSLQYRPIIRKTSEQILITGYQAQKRKSSQDIDSLIKSLKIVNEKIINLSPIAIGQNSSNSISPSKSNKSHLQSYVSVNANYSHRKISNDSNLCILMQNIPPIDCSSSDQESICSVQSIQLVIESSKQLCVLEDVEDDNDCSNLSQNYHKLQWLSFLPILKSKILEQEKLHQQIKQNIK